MALPFYDPYKGSIGRFFAGDTSLAGYWQLNGNSSDNSGNSNNGTDTAVVYAPYANKFNQSNGGVFNGSTSFIQTNAFSGVGGNFTFSFWVYLNSYPNGASLLVYIPFVVGSTTPANSFDIQFRTDASGNPILLFEIYLSGATNLEAASGVLPIKAKTWINFFATYNGSYANIYMNGKNIFNASYSGGYLNPTNTWIGRNGDYNQYYLNGNMCEVSLWKRALSQQEISDYYNWATTFKTKPFLTYQPKFSSYQDIISFLNTKILTSSYQDIPVDLHIHFYSNKDLIIFLNQAIPYYQDIYGNAAIKVAVLGSNDIVASLFVKTPMYAKTNASVNISAYKWLSQSLYNTQQQFAVSPYFKAYVVDDNVLVNQKFNV